MHEYLSSAMNCSIVVIIVIIIIINIIIFIVIIVIVVVIIIDNIIITIFEGKYDLMCLSSFTYFRWRDTSESALGV